MKRKNPIILLFLLIALSWSFDMEAQRRRRPYGKQRKKISSYRGGRSNYGGRGASQYSTVGFSINAMNYFGDITPAPSRFSTDYSFTRAGFGITYSRVIHSQAAIRAGLNYGTLTADDVNTDPTDPEGLGRYQRNLHLRNTILEFSLGFELNLIPNNGGVNNRFPLNPYLFLGAAIFRHNPQAIAPETDLNGNPLPQGGEWVDLQPLGTEGQNLGGDNPSPYSLIQFAIPIGIGVKVRLPSNFDANIEIGFRRLFTDYLDDVSTTYPDLEQITDPLTRALSNRSFETTAAQTGEPRAAEFIGNNYSAGGIRGGETKDLYVVTQLRLVYIISNGNRNRGRTRRAKFR